MERAEFADWIARYEAAWRSPGTSALAAVFTDDAVYRHSPYAEPVSGLAAIARAWEDERDGPDEVFTMVADVVAVDADVGVARVVVRYGDPVEQEYTDLWVVEVVDGLARSFEEWPFWPGQDWSANHD
ncbi:nuclear transport factor 2 family protein [Salsipaludibacter albus]|uniref:nuclear transport factor 2 family protein n=1 Tax=Salsipaludibacter albus TaxID=2849650 RepID=UPI001EE43226|nr:nuclear transport factor 2 family protein [Salsipaludibacter albus]